MSTRGQEGFDVRRSSVTSLSRGVSTLAHSKDLADRDHSTQHRHKQKRKRSTTFCAHSIFSLNRQTPRGNPLRSGHRIDQNTTLRQIPNLDPT
jgi:hypothetical protein